MSVYPDLSDQRALVEDFLRPLATLLPVARLRHGGEGDGARWREMADLGWLGISLPEAAGGIALGPVEEALAMLALGGHLPPPGVIASIVAAHALARAGAMDEAAGFAAGAARAAFAFGRGGGTCAIEPAGAQWALAIDGGRIALNAAGPTSVVDDGHWGRPLARMSLGGERLSSDDPALIGLARLLMAAALAGIASATAGHAVEYAKVREQFGQPIGAFQAVKHHCANMAIAAHAARELVTYAAIALAEDRGDVAPLADAALCFAMRAARDNAGTNIQVHGGMGFSAECDAHQFLKAAHLLTSAAGGLSTVRARLIASPAWHENLYR